MTVRARKDAVTMDNSSSFKVKTTLVTQSSIFIFVDRDSEQLPFSFSLLDCPPKDACCPSLVSLQFHQVHASTKNNKRHSFLFKD
jgi:hypothetical protein